MENVRLRKKRTGRFLGCGASYAIEHNRTRDAINAQMTELLLNTFPKTTVVLDAPDQMARQLDRLRLASGQLSPSDFLSIADSFARALGPIPVNGIAALDYHDRKLDGTFKPETRVDP